MNRHWLVAGAALAVAMPATAWSAPTGTVAHRAAMPASRAALPQGGMEAAPAHFTVPFRMSVPDKPAVAPLKVPAAQWYAWKPAYAWRPNYVVLSNPCLLTGMNLLPRQQAAWENQTLPPDVTIGSFAGNPAHSIIGASGSDVARMASSNPASTASAAPASGVQFEWQPSTCAQPYF